MSASTDGRRVVHRPRDTTRRTTGAYRRPRLPGSFPDAHPPGRVVVIGASVGQGHDGTARELARRLLARGVDVEVHDYLDALPTVAGRVLRDLYAPTVQYLPGVFDGLFHRLEHPGQLRRLARWTTALAEDRVQRWARDADVVVSTYPLAGQTLGQLRRDGRLAATSVTYLTDPAAHALWCHPSVDLHLVVTRATAQDAARYGVDARVAGPLCAPRFDRTGRRGIPRAELGLPDDAPVVLLSAGSLGMGDVPRTVAAILHHPQARAVVLCGRNDVLRRRLAGLPRVLALGWRDDVPDLMASADVLIHNAGGLSFTEALVVGLPALTYLPIPGHGRANAAVLERAGLAGWPRNPEELAAAIDRLHTDRLTTMPAWPAGADPAVEVGRVLTEHRGRILRGGRASGF